MSRGHREGRPPSFQNPSAGHIRHPAPPRCRCRHRQETLIFLSHVCALKVLGLWTAITSPCPRQAGRSLALISSHTPASQRPYVGHRTSAGGQRGQSETAACARAGLGRSTCMGEHARPLRVLLPFESHKDPMSPGASAARATFAFVKIHQYVCLRVGGCCIKQRVLKSMSKQHNC